MPGLWEEVNSGIQSRSDARCCGIGSINDINMIELHQEDEVVEHDSRLFAGLR